MKNPVRWDNLTSPQIKALAKNQAIVLVPVGSTEQHGPHLPVGCDAILATGMCERAAAELVGRGKPAVVAPCIAVANSWHHMSFAGSMTLDLDTFVQVLQEYCESIAAHGFTKIVLVNGHGGNSAPIMAALTQINECLEFPVYTMGYWAGAGEDMAAILETQRGMIHACEGETSLMLAINEDLVDPVYKETKGNMAHGIDVEERGCVSTYHRMETHTENGVMGNSYAASKEKGEKLVAVMTKAMADTLATDELWKQKV